MEVWKTFYTVSVLLFFVDNITLLEITTVEKLLDILLLLAFRKYLLT